MTTADVGCGHRPLTVSDKNCQPLSPASAHARKRPKPAHGPGPQAAPAGPKRPQRGPPQARAPKGAHGRPTRAAPAGPRKGPSEARPEHGPQRGPAANKAQKRRGGRHRETREASLAR